MTVQIALLPEVEDIDGADLYLQAMWEEAEDTDTGIDWDAMDELWADALAVDECLSEVSDWRL